MTSPLTCRTCGSTFDKTRKGRPPSYCSGECRLRARGRGPVRTHGATGYGHGCRCDVCRLAQNERMLERYHRTRHWEPERECRICHAQFIATRHTKWTCSPECQRERVRRNSWDYKARRRGAFVESFIPADIYSRDRWRCHICRRKLSPAHVVPHPRAATIDHLVPLSLGGLHEPANVATACSSCNCAKGNRGGNEQLMLVG